MSLKIGIIREGKTPPDTRVAFTPAQCKQLIEEFNIDLVVQPSPNRCFKDEDYLAAGIPMSEDVNDRDILIGIKEVPIPNLIPNKQYFFFSHTIKAQPYNKKLLQHMMANNIQMVDYEVLTNEKGKRVIAFGRFAGMVGAHNGMQTYGERTGEFSLSPMYTSHDYAEIIEQQYKGLKLPKMKIVITGNGRVGHGSKEVLLDMGIRKVTPEEYLTQEFDEAVFTMLHVKHYVQRKDGSEINKHEYYKSPELYKIDFEPYFAVSDVMMNGIYWDPSSPAFFSQKQMQQDNFNIKVIADVTCDIAPEASVPSTLRPSIIGDPSYGYNPMTGKEIDLYQENGVDIMAVDNLPNELPRDASKSFGEQFIENVIPELLGSKDTNMINKATICKNGALTEFFTYLSDYVKD